MTNSSTPSYGAEPAESPGASLLAVLRRRVAMRSVSQGDPDIASLGAYLSDEIAPSLAALGFASTVHPNARAGFGPFLVAERHEGDGLPTATRAETEARIITELGAFLK